MRKLLTRHNSKQRQYQHLLRFQPRERRSQRKSGLTMSRRSLQAQGLTYPFVSTYWPSWLISWLVLHELLRLSEETREALRDALANSESFLMYMPEIPKMTSSLLALNAIMYNQRYLLLPSQRKIYFSRITSRSTFILHRIYRFDMY